MAQKSKGFKYMLEWESNSQSLTNFRSHFVKQNEAGLFTANTYELLKNTNFYKNSINIYTQTSLILC